MLSNSKIIWLFLVWIAACSAPDERSNLFEKGRSLGKNKNNNLEEASGLVASVSNPGYLWTLNDSGHPAELFLLDTTAQTRKMFILSGIDNRDWEDIALGSCPDKTGSCVFIGDIGDNQSKYPFKLIYFFKEPLLTDPDKIDRFQTLAIKLPGGPRDTETLLSDPATQNLYIVSKREKEVMLYEIKYPFTGDTVLAENVLTINLHEIVGGDISRDGNEVLLKNYTDVFYWKKKGNESLVDLLKLPPVELAYDPEPLGEAIAWAPDGSGYYTLSENAKGERGKLYFYKRK